VYVWEGNVHVCVRETCVREKARVRASAQEEKMCMRAGGNKHARVRDGEREICAGEKGRVRACACECAEEKKKYIRAGEKTLSLSLSHLYIYTYKTRSRVCRYIHAIHSYSHSRMRIYIRIRHFFACVYTYI